MNTTLRLEPNKNFKVVPSSFVLLKAGEIQKVLNNRDNNIIVKSNGYFLNAMDVGDNGTEEIP